MELFSALVGAVAGFFASALAAFAGLVMALGGHVTVVAVPPPATAQSVVETGVFPAASSTPAAASSTPKAAQQKTAAKTAPAPAAPAVRTPSAVQAPLSPEDLNTKVRAALVNILCTTGTGGSFNPISGSGVFIDSRGIILTNAHVAQFFLLRDYPTPGNVDCVVRTGSPAVPAYRAELLYLPPAWVAANAQKIASSSPSGTGENDYAFLLVTGGANPSAALPASFPALPMDATEPSTGEQILLAAYPAGFLGGITISNNLYASSAFSSVGQLYTFDNPSMVDLFSIGGTVVSQQGSSGGAAVDMAGKLRGIIVNEVSANTTAARDLRAITLAHVDRSLKVEGGGGVAGLLSQDAAQAAAGFNANVAPAETKALEDVLNGN